MSCIAGIKFKKGKNLKKDYARSDDDVAQLVVVGRSVQEVFKRNSGESCSWCTPAPLVF